jgi:catechol 2,3-dioxygenase-like lactoylglutathione lyase family enzyme
MHIQQLNHVALHVADVDTSRQFYGGLLRLVELPRPAFDFPGAWFALAADQELHLIGDRQHAVQSHHRGGHFAVRVDDVGAWEIYLAEQGAQYLPPKRRPDGAWQLFVIDPDGHWIELMQPTATSRSLPPTATP